MSESQDDALILMAILKADESTARHCKTYGVPDFGGRDIIGSQDELRAAMAVLRGFMFELYDIDLCKDVGTCIEVVLKHLG